MASWIHTRLWVLVGILFVFGCQRYDDQPDANPKPAPALGDITILLNDSGKGDLPTPLVQDLRDGALTLQLSKPRHGEIVADVAAGRVIYTANHDFRGMDTASYTLKRGSSTTAGLVLVKVSDRFCLPIAVDDVFPLTVPFQTNLQLAILGNDHLCNGASVRLLDSADAIFSIDNEGQLVFNPPPGFNGVKTVEYELVSTTGYRSRANVTVKVAPCELGLTAKDDSVRVEFFTRAAEIYLDEILRNDVACPDSLDYKSLVISNPSPEVVILDVDTVGNHPLISLAVAPQDSLSSNRTFTFRYKVWTHSRRHSSQATVFIRRRP